MNRSARVSVVLVAVLSVVGFGCREAPAASRCKIIRGNSWTLLISRCWTQCGALGMHRRRHRSGGLRLPSR